MAERRSNADMWERKRILTSLEIERAGLALMAEIGIGSVTVEQIAAAAGISTRTYFRYFRNARNLLTGVPIRESRRICQVVMARPPDEGLLEAFHAVFTTGGAAAVLQGEHVLLELETTALWGQVVRAAPDAVRLESEATTVLAASLEDVVRTRVDLGRDDPDAVGALSAAVAAVVWFVYVRWIERGSGDSLAVHLDTAFDALARLHVGATLRAPVSPPSR